MKKQTKDLDYNIYANIIANTMLDMIEDLSILEKVDYVNNELEKTNIDKYIKNIVKVNVVKELIDALPEEDRLNYINNELTEWNEEIKNILRKNIKKENTNTNKNTNTNTNKLTNLIVNYDKDPIDELTNLIEILENEIKPNINNKYKYKTTKYKHNMWKKDLHSLQFGEINTNDIYYIGIITDISNRQTNLKDINNKLKYFGWSKERNTINNIDKIITHLKNCKIKLEIIDKEIMIERKIESEIYNNKNVISKILVNSFEKTTKKYYDNNIEIKEIIKDIKSYINIKWRSTDYKKYLEKKYNNKDIIFDLYKVCYISNIIITDIIMEFTGDIDDIEKNKLIKSKIINNWYNEFERQLSIEITSFKKRNMPTIKIQNIKTNEILTFNNTNDMANYLNVSYRSIYNLMYGKTKSCKNWKLI